MLRPGETIHLGDGAYLHYSGHDWELRASTPENPTDVVYLGREGMQKLWDEVAETIALELRAPANPKRLDA